MTFLFSRILITLIFLSLKLLYFFKFSNGQYEYPISGSDVYKNPTKYFNCSTRTIFVVTGYTSDMDEDPLYVATKSGLKKTPNIKCNL